MKTEKKSDLTGMNDWNFFMGTWRVHHRRLKARLAQSRDWVEFDGSCATRKILGGFGNTDDNVLHLPEGSYHAATVRVYDPAKAQWSIWWFDSRYPGQVDPPVVGSFANGTGTFYADDKCNGKPIRVRFLWTNLSTTPRWEQAFSEDGGKTWETNWTMEFTRIADAENCCPVLELRQYTLHPGKRDVLIELFEREFIESQEGTGLKILGQFRDLNNPDRFVWLRGSTDMESRGRQLAEFYGGPLWKAHRAAANDTMADSDNVLLLRQAHISSGFSLAQFQRPPLGATEEAKGLLVATIYYLAQGTEEKFADRHAREIEPPLAKTGASILATFVSENHPNTFPALPVRENENVFVSFALFPDRAAYEQCEARPRRGSAQQLLALTRREPEILLLAPTPRSRLHG